MPSDKFLERLAAKRAAETEQELPASQRPLIPSQQDPNLPSVPDEFKQYIVTDFEEPTPNISPEQQVLDDFISLIGIVDAYNRWIGKGTIHPGNRTESIKVRCPNPAHPDTHPSAWLNTEKNVYKCGSCDIGGDIWDLAAWHFGFHVPSYKNDPTTFRLLREKIGADFGMTIEKGIAGDLYVVTSSPISEEITQPDTPESHETQSGNTEQPASVTYTATGADEAEKEFERKLTKTRKHPSIDWRSVVEPNTFMDAYLQATTSDDVPEEYHFWNSLVALGMAVGGMRTLEDQPEVNGNLFICLTGPTGTGKSKSNRHLVNLLHNALPYSPTDQPPYGANYVKGTQSGEVLIKAFQHPMLDPITSKIVGNWPDVKGCVHFDELADLIGKSGRLGSTLKTTLMELYDTPMHLRSTSLAHGLVDAERPFGSVVTTTQFRSIRALITKSDDGAGFANRWVFAVGPPKLQDAINRTRVDLTQAISKLTGLAHSARNHQLITWSEDAEKTWTTFFHKILLPAREANQDSAIIQRIDLLLKKLFLLFAVNEKQSVLTDTIVRKVLTIYPHLLETYLLIEGEISATEEGDDVDLVMRQIARMSTSTYAPTARELHRSTMRKITSVQKLRKVLENLVVLGLIEEFKKPPGPAGGRPTTVYKLAPGVQVAS